MEIRRDERYGDKAGREVETGEVALRALSLMVMVHGHGIMVLVSEAD